MSGAAAPLRVYVSTGEASGDAHGAAVVRALRRRLRHVLVEATGGSQLAAAGAAVRHTIDGCGVMGAIEILNAVPKHVALYTDLRRRLAANAYDLVILVDYPGFHLRLARRAALAGIPVLFYIPPQLWAWGSHRAGALKRGASHVAVILPFEEQFLRARGIPATFVGHPLLDRLPLPSRSQARAALGLSPDAPVLGIFPGSRPAEVRRLWPSFRDAAAIVRRALPDVTPVLAAVAGGQYPQAEEFVVCQGNPRDVFA
ncbi:MAG: hypothetical protein HY560_02535, partial [Gemmatimonadetes bacterium]|nr:hypothetical protein [Gemmatimonadota bacterium]